LIPEQIEEIITWNSFPIFVGGIADAVLGEISFGNEGEKQLLDEHIYKSLDKYQKPKEIFYIDKFIETENGKIKRKNVREHLNSLE
jgi:O-succinylbenzoic acid--CoA ligase